MTSPRSPRNSPANRRPDPSVYKRRRIIALAALAIVVIILWNIIAGIANFIGGLTGSNQPDVSATPGSTVAASTACAPGAVQIEGIVANGARSPQSSFAVGINPLFGYKITNTSATDCTFDVGGAVTFFTVTSGTETIWDSKLCDRSTAINNVIALKAGTSLTSDFSDWFRVYSSETGCSADQKAVPAGGASYHLGVSVNGVIAANDVQFVLN